MLTIVYSNDAITGPHRDFCWQVFDEKGLFVEGHSSIHNAVRAQPTAQIDGQSYGQFLGELNRLVDGKLVGVEKGR